MRFALLAALFLVFAHSAAAIEPSEMIPNHKLQARATQIDKELRCLVCQNESIYASHASLAHDLRMLVRKLVLKGDSNAQIKQYIVARYGDYVLLKPPFDPETYLLWFGPVLLLCAGAATAIYFYRRQPATEPLPLSDEEKSRLEAIDEALR